MKNIIDLVGYIKDCLNVIKDTKGEVFETGREVGQIEIYLHEIKTILNQPKEEIKSNDSFQWDDEKVAQAIEYTMKDNAGVLTPYGVRQNVKYFKEDYPPKPQAENKPDIEYDKAIKTLHSLPNYPPSGEFYTKEKAEAMCLSAFEFCQVRMHEWMEKIKSESNVSYPRFSEFKNKFM